MARERLQSALRDRRAAPGHRQAFAAAMQLRPSASFDFLRGVEAKRQRMCGVNNHDGASHRAFRSRSLPPREVSAPEN